MVLANPKHERFAQERAKGKTADEAYQLAGYSENRGNATRMNANESIRARIDEIMHAVAQKTEVTLESLMAEADEIARLARASGQLGAANGALKLKAVFAGLYVEKADNVVRNATDPHAIPDDKLADIAVRDQPQPEPILPMLSPEPAESEERLN